MPKCPKCECAISSLVRVQQRVAVTSVDRVAKTTTTGRRQEPPKTAIIITAEECTDSAIVEETYNCPICNAFLFDNLDMALAWLMFEDFVGSLVEVFFDVPYSVGTTHVCGRVTKDQTMYSVGEVRVIPRLVRQVVISTDART